MRKENRQRSVQEMIERTRQITAGIHRPPPMTSGANAAAAEYDLQNIGQIPVPRTKQQTSSQKKQDDILRRNSEKYEEMMRQRKDELKRKRGALELNSDLDLDI